MPAQRKMMIVAGEASGDMHGAKLADALYAHGDHLTLFGIGGDRMRSAGVRIDVDARQLAVVGITEVFAKLTEILRGLRIAKHLIVAEKPDLLILIDFPDFNLHLAAFAKKRGVSVLYYISPQIWAWRRGRVQKIKRLVDHMAVILPFEETFYRQHAVPVTFVGHPLMDRYTARPVRSVKGAADRLSVVGLMPGSRDSEVRKLLPLMLAAARKIRQRKKVRFLLSRAPSVCADLVNGYLKEFDVAVTIFNGPTENLLGQVDLIIVASGTSTLEAAIHATPMIIVYRVSPLSYRVGKALIKVPHIGLVNLIAGKRAVPELIQHEASPEQIARQTLTLLGDPDKMKRMKDDLAEVSRRLGAAGASDKVAKIGWALLASGPRETNDTSADQRDYHEV
ncbi:MAG: lipid-A-disaccharide synthase [Desulfobacterales bacterium]|jgi:lipid-A-disaccharide synthase